MRNFYNVGIIFDDGRQRWLVRPSRRIADANQSTVSHVVISKVPEIKQHSAEKPLLLLSLRRHWPLKLPQLVLPVVR